MKLPKIVLILAFEESRKVAFGLWLFIFAGVFLVRGLIDSDKWMLCASAASVLIGGGTLADAYLGKKKAGKDAQPSAGD